MFFFHSQAILHELYKIIYYNHSYFSTGGITRNSYTIEQILFTCNYTELYIL